MLSKGANKTYEIIISSKNVNSPHCLYFIIVYYFRHNVNISNKLSYILLLTLTVHYFLTGIKLWNHYTERLLIISYHEYPWVVIKNVKLFSKYLVNGKYKREALQSSANCLVICIVTKTLAFKLPIQVRFSQGKIEL